MDLPPNLPTPIRDTNAHGCVAYVRCNCPRAYHRCSLFTNWPERDSDPVVEGNG